MNVGSYILYIQQQNPITFKCYGTFETDTHTYRLYKCRSFKGTLYEYPNIITVE